MHAFEALARFVEETEAVDRGYRDGDSEIGEKEYQVMDSHVLVAGLTIISVALPVWIEIRSRPQRHSARQ